VLFRSQNASVLGTLPALNELDRARLLYSQNSGWGTHFLLASRFIENNVIDSEQRVLHAYFLPRIAAEIEQRLDDNIKDANMLYAYLKGYLAFSSSDYTNQNSIKAPMEYNWDNNFAAHPETADKLKHYLNFALQHDVEKLPLDQKLIDRIRDRLETVIPSERAYGLLTLRARVSDYPDILLSTAAGSEFDSVFIEKDSSYRIPRLYTDAVYHNIYLPHYEDIASEVANDNKDIGLSSASAAKDTESDLEDNIQMAYNNHYIQVWQTALNNINIKAFSSLKEAVNTLDALIGKNSPLPKVLNIVYDNTNDVSHDKVQVVGHFEDVNDYSQSNNWGTTWQDSVKTLTKLRDYLVKLEQAPNQSEASFNAAQAVIQGSDNPMQQLAKQAETAPQPVQRWLHQLANQCWQIIVKSAYREINHAWEDKIMVTYDKGMRDRFPFNVHSNADVNIADFNHIFGSGQVLDSFFTKYIKPFVNTDLDNGHWQLYNIHGLTMEFSPKLLAMFQQAKEIQHEFFPNDAKTTNFVLNVKPLTLSDKAASVEFVVGPQQMLYSHGPQNVSTVTWPLPFNNETSRIVITDFKSNQFSHWAHGPWSLFKLFQQGDFHPIGDDGSYRFNLNFKGYSASYEITGPSDMNIFTLKHLKGFAMPNKIAPVLPAQKKQESNND
jgi:type VI secretion system protein ImpL